MWISPLVLSLLPLPPSRSWRNTDLSSLCYIAASHQLPALRVVVYTRQCCSLSTSHLLLPALRPQVHSLRQHVYSLTRLFESPLLGTWGIFLKSVRQYSPGHDSLISTHHPWWLEEASPCLLYVPLSGWLKSLRVMPCLLSHMKAGMMGRQGITIIFIFSILMTISNIIIIVSHQWVLHHGVILKLLKSWFSYVM